jgi:Bacterial PH domain
MPRVSKEVNRCRIFSNLLGCTRLIFITLSGLTTLPVLLMALACVLTARLWLSWYRTAVYVTDQGVILERGGVSRVINMEAVQDLRTHQTAFGKMLGFGSIEIQLMSGYAIVINSISQPERLRDQLGVLSDAARNP